MSIYNHNLESTNIDQQESSKSFWPSMSASHMTQQSAQ